MRVGISKMDDTVFAAVSYLHTAFRRRNRIRRSRAKFRLRQMYAIYDSFIAIYQRQMLLRMIVTAGLIFAATMPAERSEWSKALGHFRYMWSRSRSTPHIAFTLQNLTHLLGSKLPQSGSFDPHRIHIVNVGSNPLILCSHYTGKWFRCRVDPTSLHQKVLM